jgi:DNA-binding XRE family transcriptional regulator
VICFIAASGDLFQSRPNDSKTTKDLAGYTAFLPGAIGCNRRRFGLSLLLIKVAVRRTCTEKRLRNPQLSQARLNALKILGGNIRRERTARRMSQEKLALFADLNVRTICKIEAGELNIHRTTIERIQQALGCPMITLLKSSQQEGGLADTTLTSILKRLSTGL